MKIALHFFERLGTTIVRWAISIFTIFVIWQYFLYQHISHVFFASPHDTYTEMSLWWHDGTLWSIVGTTLSEAGTGFAIGIALGLLTGLTIGLAPYVVGKVIEPVVIGVYAMPKLVLAPLLFVTMGAGFTPRVFIVIMAVFPVITIYTVTGIRTVDPDVTRMMQLFGASKRQIGRKLLVPHTMGYFVTGLLFVAPHAVTISIGAEILFGTTGGIGGVLNTYSNNFIAKGVLAALVVGTIVSALAIGVTRFCATRLLGGTGLAGGKASFTGTTGT